MPKKFVEAFANVGPKRLPTESERQNGFPCGPADQLLFNGLFHDIQAELGHLISYAGLTDNSDDLQQVRKAIEALITAAIGGIDEGEGPDLTGFVLLSQLRSRIPLFPEILTTDNRINITSPGSGSILVPPTINILHRGVFPKSTSDFTELARTFATAANKTYHLRLNLAPGSEALSLKDLANGTYNPTAAAESDPKFDSTYDDVLLARIVTNGSNVATITNLRNAVELDDNVTNTGSFALANQNGADRTVVNTFNWARRPRIVSIFHSFGGTGDWQVNDHDTNEQVLARTRYQTTIYLLRDGASSGSLYTYVAA
jgi:hypothetical protein